MYVESVDTHQAIDEAKYVIFWTSGVWISESYLVPLRPICTHNSLFIDCVCRVHVAAGIVSLALLSGRYVLPSKAHNNISGSQGVN